MSPMQQVNKKMSSMHASPSDGNNYQGYAVAQSPPPGGIPKEVLQAASMQGSGRRNIKIRAVQ